MCLKMNCKFSCIFRTFSWNRHHSHTGARFWEGFYTKKVRQNVIFLCCFEMSFFRAFASSFLVNFWLFFTTHHFTSIKLTFKHVQALFSSLLRCLNMEKSWIYEHFGALAREWRSFYKRNSMFFDMYLPKIFCTQKPPFSQPLVLPQ